MKRTWKNFRLDPNKVYAFIGKATVVILANMGMSAMLVFGFLQNTIYQEESMKDLEKEKQEEKEEKRRFYLSLISLALAIVALVINLWFK